MKTEKPIEEFRKEFYKVFLKVHEKIEKNSNKTLSITMDEPIQKVEDIINHILNLKNKNFFNSTKDRKFFLHILEIYERHNPEDDFTIPPHVDRVLIKINGEDLIKISDLNNLIKTGSEVFNQTVKFNTFENMPDSNLISTIPEPLLSRMQDDVNNVRKSLSSLYNIAFSALMNHKIAISKKARKIAHPDFFYLLQKSEIFDTKKEPFKQKEYDLLKILFQLRDNHEPSEKILYDEEGNSYTGHDLEITYEAAKKLIYNQIYARAWVAQEDLEFIEIMKSGRLFNTKELKKAVQPLIKLYQSIEEDESFDDMISMDNYYKINHQNITACVIETSRGTTVRAITKQEYGLILKIEKYIEKINPNLLNPENFKSFTKDIVILKRNDIEVKLSDFIKIYRSFLKIKKQRPQEEKN